ncbi:regulator of G-protein signaling 6-like [Engraulis encrasicolus]|uniref:regulator of G-protein signaling 6-like n=1 Tax=Engraulis encrasicolus TaxID=184585 RepID=UPI002FD52358
MAQCPGEQDGHSNQDAQDVHDNQDVNSDGGPQGVHSDQGSHDNEGSHNNQGAHSNQEVHGNQGVHAGVGVTNPDEAAPNMVVYRKIEDLMFRLQEEEGGVAIRTVKNFLSKIPCVTTGSEIVHWLMKNLCIEDTGEALHLGSLMAALGYFFPVSEHTLSLRDDGTLYRFQSQYFWPSNYWEPDSTDYAIYLCKRTMQNKARLELADYEAENLARLHKAFNRKWEFIFMQAEAQVKIDRKRERVERKIHDSQERAFWDVHRPVPGCVNTTEMDIRKCRREKNPHKVKKCLYAVIEEGQPLPAPSPIHTHTCRRYNEDKEVLQKTTLTRLLSPEKGSLCLPFSILKLDRHCTEISKMADSVMSYSEQFQEFDPFLTPPEPSNPWLSNDTSLWETENREPHPVRVKKWSFSLEEALKDPAGRELFLKFLQTEFSSENLRFWLAVQDLKCRPLVEVSVCVRDIWSEFLAEGAPSSINLDSHTHETTSINVRDPGRYSFEDAQMHIFQLMKRDSYCRFLRSSTYQDLLTARKSPPGGEKSGRRKSLEKITRIKGKCMTGKRQKGVKPSS